MKKFVPVQVVDPRGDVASILQRVTESDFLRAISERINIRRDAKLLHLLLLATGTMRWIPWHKSMRSEVMRGRRMLDDWPIVNLQWRQTSVVYSCAHQRHQGSRLLRSFWLMKAPAYTFSPLSP